MSLAQTAIVPPWLVIGLTAVAMLVVSAHVLSLQKAEMPASRRRIRTANGMLMLIVTPLMAYALQVPHLQQPQTFTLGWLMVFALLILIVLLALLDILNNVRLHGAQREELARQQAEALAEKVAARRGAGATGGGSGAHGSSEQDHGR